jgi:Zn-dependent peptidase ImmA (M78 family)
MQVRTREANETLTRAQYFRQMKALAQQTRTRYPKECATLSLTSVKSIYKAEKIELDYRNIKSPRIRAAYFCDECGCSVMVKKSLPKEPKLFSLVHELKHHLSDQQLIIDGKLVCGDYNENEQIEVGAEVFAAEFIYPEEDMRRDCQEFGIRPGVCSEEDIVRFKKWCKRPVSYTFLLKRLRFLNVINGNQFESVQFQKLEEKLFPPIYKQQWFVDYRKRRRARSNG